MYYAIIYNIYIYIYIVQYVHFQLRIWNATLVPNFLLFYIIDIFLLYLSLR